MLLVIKLLKGNSSLIPLFRHIANITFNNVSNKMIITKTVVISFSFILKVIAVVIVVSCVFD